jgi:hypothetical protein
VDTKALIATVAALAALVVIFAIMSDCSKQVAAAEADPQRACVEGGGTWWSEAPNRIGQCAAKERK